MSSTPVVLISSDNRIFEEKRWHMTPAQYAEAVVVGARAIPVLLPSVGDMMDVVSVLDRVDGVVLSGAASNVHPSCYGVEPAPEYEPYDEARDATTLPLIRAALQRGIPLFAICRGYQELNVALGGSLHTEIHEIDGRFDHRSPESNSADVRYGLRHLVRVVGEGCIGQILGDDDVSVNSLHRQGIAEISSRLRIEATASDGTIEAVSVIDAKTFAVGVQWHPEYWVREDTASARLFSAFGDAVRAYAAVRDEGYARAAAE
jgi:putative glutamine amidotransferase